MFPVLLVATALAAPPSPPEAPADPGARPPAVPEAPIAPTPLAPRWSSGESLRVEEPVDDLFALAQRVEIRSLVADNALTVAERTLLTEQGRVAGDVMSLGALLDVDGEVGGDVYVGAGEVELGPRGRIGGHLFVGAGEVRLEGPIGGDLRGSAGTVHLNGPVHGSVDLDVGRLVLGPDAHVYGDLHYSSTEPADADAAARVAGATVFDRQLEEVQPDGPPSHRNAAPDEEEGSLIASLLWTTLWSSWKFAGGLLLGMAWLLLGGSSARATAQRLVDQPAQAAGMGFVSLISIPVLCLASIALIVPIPLGFVGMLVYLLGLLLAGLITSQALGDVLLDRLRPGAQASPYVSLAVGLALLTLLDLVPYLGGLISLVATVLGLGALAGQLLAGRSRPAI